MNSPVRKLAFALSAWLCAVSVDAHAMPTLQDHWRLFCAPFGFNKKVMARAKSQANKGGLRGAIGALNAACVQSALELKQYQEKLAKVQEAGGTQAPKLNNAQSRAMIKQASARLRAVYNKQKMNPEAIYYHAYALALQGDDWAVNRFDDVITKFKKSRWVDDATLAMAEYFFDKSGLPQSQDYYNRALKAKKPLVQNYARYKMAWIGYIAGAQARQPAQQKRAIYQLAQLSKRTRAGRGVAKGLGEKIKNDVIDLAVDFGDIAEAQRILQSVGATDVYASLLERMAYSKIQAGDAANAYKLFAMALKQDGTGANAPQMHSNLVQLSVQMQNFKLLVANLKNMTNMYLSPKSPWRRANNKNKKLVKKTIEQVEGLVFEYATALDRDGRDTNNPANLALAMELYQLFEKRFKKSKNLYQVKFLQAQLLYIQQKYVECTKAILALIKEKPKGKFVRDSLDVLVTAAQTAMDADKTKYKLPPPGSAKKPIKLPGLKKLYADALDVYVKYKPQDQNAPAMMYAAASVYYDFGNYKEGNKRYLKFVRRFPTNEFAIVAAARLFEYQKLQGNPKSYIGLKKRLASIGPIRQSADLAPYWALPQKKKKPTKKKPPAKEEPAEIAEGAASPEGAETVSDETKSEPGEEEATQQEAPAAEENSEG